MTANINANLANWSTTASSNQPDGTDTADIDADFQVIQAVVRKYLATKGTDIASASTVDLATATGNYVHVTGTTSVTALGTVAAGLRYLLVFDDVLTLTHNGTSLILPSAANITTAAGDAAEFVSLGSGNWRCLWYSKASGASLIAYQPLDAELTAIAGLTSDASKIPYFTGSGTADLLDLKDEDDMASDSATALPTQQSVKAYVTTQVAGGGLVAGTAVDPASGTSVDFTSIPAWVKRITVMFSSVSTNGTSRVQLQIGTSGVAVATGYIGRATTNGQDISITTGIPTAGTTADAVRHAAIVFSKVNGNIWNVHGSCVQESGDNALVVCGAKTLSGALDMVRITTVNGTDQFDAGVINVLYE